MFPITICSCQASVASKTQRDYKIENHIQYDIHVLCVCVFVCMPFSTFDLTCIESFT